MFGYQWRQGWTCSSSHRTWLFGSLFCLPPLSIWSPAFRSGLALEFRWYVVVIYARLKPQRCHVVDRKLEGILLAVTQGAVDLLLLPALAMCHSIHHFHGLCAPPYCSVRVYECKCGRRRCYCSHLYKLPRVFREGIECIRLKAHNILVFTHVLSLLQFSRSKWTACLL